MVAQDEDLAINVRAVITKLLAEHLKDTEPTTTTIATPATQGPEVYEMEIQEESGSVVAQRIATEATTTADTTPTADMTTNSE
jgi:hypothetical protein